MARLIVPNLNEMKYREKLLEQEGKGPFTKDEWPAFYHAWTEQDDRYLAYIYCNACEDFTGIVSWCYDEQQQEYVIDVLIDKIRRHTGYGSGGIRLLKEAAKEKGISRFIAPVPKGSSVTEFFEKNGFQKDHETEDSVIYTLDF